MAGHIPPLPIPAPVVKPPSETALTMVANPAAIASEVYAQQLFKLALGYPLWDPEPTNGQGEVLIGDVGYLGQGGFYRLFNATREAEDSIQIAVPPDFKKFQLGSIPITSANDVVDKGPLFSKTVRRLEAAGGAGSQSVNAAFQCECTGKQGALAILDTPGKRELVQQTRRMAKYMKDNIETWHRWAISNDVGLDVAIEDILFVRGWIKTSCWAVVAFCDDSRHTKLTFSGDLGLPVSNVFGIETQVETTTPTCLLQIGPQRFRRANATAPLVPNQPAHVQEQYPSDQCMFLHYFKLKKRLLWPSKIEAAAEPRDPSVDRDTDNRPTVKQTSPRVKPYDPVTFVLDYILEHSDAAVAVASDIDLIRVCEVRRESSGSSGEDPIPDDITQFLEEVQPPIEVTEDGLGFLLLNDEEAELHDPAGHQRAAQADVRPCEETLAERGIIPSATSSPDDELLIYAGAQGDSALTASGCAPNVDGSSSIWDSDRATRWEDAHPKRNHDFNRVNSSNEGALYRLPETPVLTVAA